MSGVCVPRRTIDWLLEPSNPTVRLLTLENLFNRPQHDKDVAEARGRVGKSPWVRRLMREQHPDGWWVNPKNCYTPRGVATVWYLQVLAELRVPGDDPRVVRACDRFLMQNGMPDGGFACGVHRKRYSEECLTGHMLYTLVAFGRGDDPRAHAARDWLLARQLPDEDGTVLPDVLTRRSYRLSER